MQHLLQDFLSVSDHFTTLPSKGLILGCFYPVGILKATLDSFRNFAYISSYLHERVLHGNKIVQYLQNYKRHEVDQVHSKNLLYRVLQVTSKWKTLKQPIYFLKVVEFWPTFDIQISHNFCYIITQKMKYYLSKCDQIRCGFGHIYWINP